MYEQGLGVQQDLAKAVELFRQAHLAGDAMATSNLGVLYERGKAWSRTSPRRSSCTSKRTKRNSDAALNLGGLYEQAHAAGNPDATLNLGIMYEQGKGVEQDFERAVDLYEQAHRDGNAVATCNLGLICEKHRDYAEAVKMYKLAHAAGNSVATCNLGVLYEQGKG